MARPIKKGLDYYPLDVDFLQDIKVRKIMRACGIQSVAILISLLSSIYRDEGYYVVWDSDMSFLVADEVGASEGAVLEVVKKAIQTGFFDENIYENYKVLTSRGIQKRFLEVANRRKSINFISEYLLIDLDNEYNNLVNVDINSINVGKSTQSKVKKSKEEKSKENTTSTTMEPEQNIFDEELKELAQLYQKCGFDVNGLTPDWLMDLKERFGFEWVKNAILEAEKQGARRKAYVEKILSNWQRWGGMKLSTDNKPDANRSAATPAAKKTKFHNFKQRTDNYSADQLEDIARRKREEYFKKAQEGGN